MQRSLAYPTIPGAVGPCSASRKSSAGHAPVFEAGPRAERVIVDAASNGLVRVKINDFMEAEVDKLGCFFAVDVVYAARQTSQAEARDQRVC